MKSIKTLPILFAAIALTSVLYSCGSDSSTDTDSQTPSELLDDAGEGINNAVDDAGNAIDNAVEGVNDAAHDAVDGAREAIDEANSEAE